MRVTQVTADGRVGVPVSGTSGTIRAGVERHTTYRPTSFSLGLHQTFKRARFLTSARPTQNISFSLLSRSSCCPRRLVSWSGLLSVWPRCALRCLAIVSPDSLLASLPAPNRLLHRRHHPQAQVPALAVPATRQLLLLVLLAALLFLLEVRSSAHSTTRESWLINPWQVS